MQESKQEVINVVSLGRKSKYIKFPKVISFFTKLT